MTRSKFVLLKKRIREIMSETKALIGTTTSRAWSTNHIVTNRLKNLKVNSHKLLWTSFRLLFNRK